MRSHRWWLGAALALTLGCGSEAGATGGSSAAEPTAGAEATGPIGLPNERHPREGLITSGAPQESQLARAADRGVDKVISLQTRSEPGAEQERAVVEGLGMEFVRIPVPGPAGITAEKAAELHRALLVPPGDEVLLHCGSGNRAGALLALRAFYYEGASVEEALELGRAAGLTELEPVVRQHLEGAEPARTPEGEGAEPTSSDQEPAG